MTERTEIQSQIVPEETSRDNRAAGRRGRSLALLGLVALVSVATGAGATFLAFRPVAPLPATSEAAGGHRTHSSGPVAPEAEPPSDRAVFVPPARQQLIGVRTAEVAPRVLETTIRTVGVLAYDETRVAEIHTKVAGWLESVSADFVGRRIRRGQPLFSVYSPDLVATQKEYLLALRAQEQLGTSRFAETREGAGSLVAATRERLHLWDLTDAQIAELGRTREPRRTVTVYSPFDGIVLERNAYPGQYVTPEARAFRIADLSTIWVIGQVFEYELPLVEIGQLARIEFPYGSVGRTLSGPVTFIYPEVDPMTRRVKIRIELRNPGFEFRPESYVTVVIGRSGGERLAVPREAIIDTGERRYAILALGNGYFEPREVEVGEPTDDFYPVLAGLRERDRVVTSAQFLIDSETNLQAAMQNMVSAPPPDRGAGPRADAGSAAQVPTASLTFSTEPSPPRVGENVFETTVSGRDGQPVTDAEVRVAFFMAAMASMGMPAMRTSATLTHAGGGAYRGTGQIATAGRWDVTVTASRAGQSLGSRRLSVVVP
jgi:RND family efflux transporter MFP subunit